MTDPFDPLSLTTLSDKVTTYCSVQAALDALTTIGTDANGNPNVGVTRSALDGSPWEPVDMITSLWSG